MSISNMSLLLSIKLVILLKIYTDTFYPISKGGLRDLYTRRVRYSKRKLNVISLPFIKPNEQRKYYFE